MRPGFRLPASTIFKLSAVVLISQPCFIVGKFGDSPTQVQQFDAYCTTEFGYAGGEFRRFTPTYRLPAFASVCSIIFPIMTRMIFVGIILIANRLSAPGRLKDRPC